MNEKDLVPKTYLLDRFQSSTNDSVDPVFFHKKVGQVFESRTDNFVKGFFHRITTMDLEMAFDAVDGVYFEGNCRKLLEKEGHSLSFRLAKRMTHCGGTTTRRPMRGVPGRFAFEIAIAPRLLDATFATLRTAQVTGVICDTPRDALLRIMEHEQLHLLEMLIWDSSSCSQARFRDLAQRIFGHRESTHQLMTPNEVAKAQHQIAVGNRVVFKFENQTLTGRVNRINRRATVLVEDSQGERYTDGQRYRKFYVPMSMLRRVE